MSASGSATKFPDGRHTLRLGESFFSKSAPIYHTIRYDFKPASVEDCKETFVEVAENQEVTVTVPKLDEIGEVKDATMFKGPRKKYQKECLLIYNHDTGEFVLEQLSYNIQLKKTRGEVTDEVFQSIRETRKKLSSLNSSTPPLPLPPTMVLLPSASVDNNCDAKEAATQLMSDSSDESDSDSSKSSGDGSDDAQSDVDDNDVNMTGNGDEFSEDELAKSLEAELSSSQHHSSTRNMNSDRTTFQDHQQTSSQSGFRLEADLLLSESSDDDDDD